ncbi:MAG TPA: terpene utilization protein AtuA, partial [Marinobacter hydrocarbonoclasticus]|nr:terpene utilization protein AtuA [Marinobacter nauticus]
SREIAQAATGMAPGITGIVGGRPTVWPKIRLYSCLVPKSEVAVSVDLASEKSEVEVATEGGFNPGDLAAEPESRMEVATDTTVPLLKLAWARSGDKGDHSNIGVIARDREYVPYIEA